MSHIVYMVSTDPYSGRGGIASAVSSFLACLKMRNIQSKVFITHNPSVSKTYNAIFFIRTLAFLAVSLMCDLVKRQRVILYLHAGPRGSLYRKVIVAVIARSLRVKVYSHMHSAEFASYLSGTNLNSRALRFLCRMSCRNLVLSSWWRAEFSRYGITNTEIVPNAISGPECESAIFHVKSRSEKTKVIFSLGRLVPGKNFELLIKALTLMDDSHHLTIGGDGPLYSDLCELEVVSGVEHRVSFLGWLDSSAINNLFISSDLFVLPSNNDSFGLVFIEALAAGCPVVASPNAAIQSALKGLEGVYYPPDYEAHSLKEAIAIALSVTPNRRSISINCKTHYGYSAVSEVLVNALQIE